ncbi:hypothetical protein L484_008467 [Morus notabilis]|uniref:CASP-like protein n=1 Tax=Morus notabilis TaxID=981085 RepID=W9S0X6_9ROSA|nr:CASP-like protein 1D1 [Morus notabilis]EXC03135.1 hypothetical protein L484_008467 [Morus notabilis]
MASTEEVKTDTESGKEAPPPQPVLPSTATSWFKVDVVLRVLLFASTVTSLVVLVTSKQSISGRKFGLPPGSKVQIKFNNSPSFIYFLVALAVAGLYSIVTTLASISVTRKPQYSTKFLLHFVFWDVLILGILASAVGTAGGVAYVGLKGNDDVQWKKVCNNFDKFCRHIGASLAVSLCASVLLIFLIWLNVNSLHKKIPK